MTHRSSTTALRARNKVYNLNLGSMHTDKSDHEIIQNFGVNSSDGCVCPRTYCVDEVFEGILSDDDLVNYVKEYWPIGSVSGKCWLGKGRKRVVRDVQTRPTKRLTLDNPPTRPNANHHRQMAGRCPMQSPPSQDGVSQPGIARRRFPQHPPESPTRSPETTTGSAASERPQYHGRQRGLIRKEGGDRRRRMKWRRFEQGKPLEAIE